MTKKQAWIHALRLRTLPLSISGIILGSALAFYKGFDNYLVLGFALLTTLLFQILSNLANDLGDSLKGTDNAQRVGPTRAVQSGVISPKEMKNAVILTSFLSFISAGILIYFGTQEMPQATIFFYISLAIACVAAAILYTVGKKAYGYNGLGDFMVYLFFGLVSVMGVYPLFAKTIDWNLLMPASTIGLLSTAVLNLNNMRDRVNDAASGKRTLVVMMGGDLAKIYHTFLIVIALGLHLYFISELHHDMAFIGLLPGVVLLLHVRKVMQTKNPKDFDPELKKVALSTFALALLTAVGLLVQI
jgi:1,4-dihydroxy-2-naphthoate octaprenyltransferase